MLGDNIRRERRLRNIKQEFVAQKLGIKQGTYSRIETGRIKPSYECVATIAAIIGCHVCDFADTKPFQSGAGPGGASPSP